MINSQSQNKISNKSQSLVSAVLKDGSLVEMIHRPEENKTAFLTWKVGSWSELPEINDGGQKFVPYTPTNNLLQNQVILFPSGVEEYGSEEELLREIGEYLHRYVDLNPLFEKIASYYVLFSWVYDGFNELPYIRVRGEPGSGKTRFLQVVGSVCNKPIFASGASSMSPIFRILDSFRGTLIIDESDFRFSDEKADMVKILNNGNVRGFPVLRSEVSPITKEFNPRAYHVFGPKLIATRGFFEDRALESRFLTEDMGQRSLRGDVPINLPDTYKTEALHLRNKLLLFRFRNFGSRTPLEALVDRSIEPRLNQVFAPLLSVIQDEGTRAEIRELAKTYHDQMISERGFDIEAELLEVIRNLHSPQARLSVKGITDAFIKKHGEEYDRRITPKYIGQILRRKLGIRTAKSHGVFVIPLADSSELHRLYERYGLVSEEKTEMNGQDAPPESPPTSPSPPENLPDGQGNVHIG